MLNRISSWASGRTRRVLTALVAFGFASVASAGEGDPAFCAARVRADFVRVSGDWDVRGGDVVSIRGGGVEFEGRLAAGVAGAGGAAAVRLAEVGPSGHVWFAAEGLDGSRAVLATDGRGFAGAIRWPDGRVVEVWPDRDGAPGVVRLRAVGGEMLGGREECVVDDGAEAFQQIQADGAARRVDGLGRGGVGLGVVRDDSSTVRLLVVYTPAVRAELGGTAQAELFAAAAVATINDANASSLIGPLEVELSGTAEYAIPMAEGSTSLRYLANPGDGVADGAHDLREALRADLVAGIVELTDACGTAWRAPGFRDWAFSVTDVSCVLGNLSFVHEVGHNFGCNHDPDNASPGSEPAYGHRWFGQSGTQYRSIMAYSPGTRVARFSNPGVFYDGVATGILFQRDNAAQIDDTTFDLAQHLLGSVDPSDCDESGVPDSVEIALGSVDDCNLNGVADSCDLATGLDADCDADGRLDSCQLAPSVRVETGPMGPIGDGVTVRSKTLTSVSLAVSTVSVDLNAYANFATGAEVILKIDGIQFASLAWSGSFDCRSLGHVSTFTVPAATFNTAASDGAVEVRLEVRGDVAPNGCSADTYANVRFDYTGVSADDLNADGVLDACACPADLTSDGEVDSGDLQVFITAFLAGDAGVADLTGDGQVDSGDLQAFITAFLAGC